MTMMSDLPQDLEKEILSRVPITSLRAVRLTCKHWNGLFKDGSFIKNHYGNEFLVIKSNGIKVCLMSLNLNGNQSIKRIGKVKLGYTSRFIHCHGLLLVVTKERNITRFMVWNPYLGQTRWMEPRTYDGTRDFYGFGYDKKKNHKILRLVYDFENNNVTQETYDLKSNSWKVQPAPSAIMYRSYTGVSVKGSSYFLAKETRHKDEEGNNAFCLLGFDFTREAFGPRLELPFLSDVREHPKVLSAVREEKLVVLIRPVDTLEMKIWITNKVETNAVSWNKFLDVNMVTITGFKFMVHAWKGFFVDEEKKVAVFSEVTTYEPNMKKTSCGGLIGEGGYLKELDLGKESRRGGPFVYSYYAPSSVQIQPI